VGKTSLHCFKIPVSPDYLQTEFLKVRHNKCKGRVVGGIFF
jgi:hypothetical protein